MRNPGLSISPFTKAVKHATARQWPEAAECWRRGLRIAPDRPEAWDGLGMAAYHMGHLVEAERCFRRAVELRPDDANLRDHLGIALRALGRPREAIEQYEKALTLQSDRSGTFNNLGNALCDLEDPKRGVEALQRAVTLAPDEQGYRVNLARALIRHQRGEEAIAQLEHVRASQYDPRVDVEYGHALIQLERYTEAIDIYRRAAAAGIRDHGMFHNLATALQYFGRNDEAAEAYRTALAIRPDYAPSRRQLTSTQKYEKADLDAVEIEELLKAPDLSVADRADLHIGLAKIHDDLNNYEKAFLHLQTGNQLIRSTLDYSADRNSAYIDAVIETFNQEFLAVRRHFGSLSEVPVFIVGMPRSGTTLAEQILSSHPMVHGAGELKKIYDLFAGLRQRLTPDLGMPRIARLIDSELANFLASEYLEYLIGLAPGARFICDKMPFNFRALGFIALLFPKARIIHCRRNPYDTALSCYFARFHDQLNFSFNLVEIAHYYRDYERLMAHWQAVLDNPILELQYEDLVADQECETRRLLEFCDLDWDERCLKFYDTERAVLTASNWQVRQPIYTSSVERWRHYQQWLGPLLTVLGTVSRYSAAEERKK